MEQSESDMRRSVGRSVPRSAKATLSPFNGIYRAQHSGRNVRLRASESKQDWPGPIYAYKNILIGIINLYPLEVPLPQIQPK